MTLASGSRFGAYDILSLIGVGGMGEVYRARDTKLGRDVAIKILPPDLAVHSDRLARFEREARLLAVLNHPHVAAIYGVEESDGMHALVLELVEGPTLADRLTRGPIPYAEALGVARQIADALDAAHERGIVHRDLKPSNIKISADGGVKVLDFGLGKATAPDAGDPTQSPTVTVDGTRAGVILGTAAYMSPEQARGQIVDKRADIWAFGCVLYEMLTAKRAFEGEHLSDTLANVLRSEPNLGELPPSAAPLTSLLRRCLEKDPRRRLRDIADAMLWLDDMRGGEATPSLSAAGGRAWWWIAAAAVLGVVVGTALVSLRRPTLPLQAVSRFELFQTQANPLYMSAFGSNVAISPDGSRIVYVATRRGAPELVVRRLDQLEATPLSGTEGAIAPFFSPDGRQLAFASDVGAAAATGRLVWKDRRGARVGYVEDEALPFPRNVRLSPDARRLVVTLGPSGLGDLWIYDVLGAAQPLKLTFRDFNSFAIWSPDGTRIAFFGRAGIEEHLFSLPADGSVMQPERLTASAGDTGLPTSWSPDGSVSLVQDNGIKTLRTSDRFLAPWFQTPFAEFGGLFSPNGRWVAYTTNQTGAFEVWVRPFPGPGAPVRVSAGGGVDPVWSRDGKELFYHIGPQLMSARVVITDAPAFRADAPQVLFEGGFFHNDTDPGIRLFDVAPDGRFLMIERPTSGSQTIVVAQHWDEELRRLLPIK